MKKVLIALEILLILLIGGGLILIYSGVYNMAATDQHGGVVSWIFETTRNQSVRNHAEGIRVPPLEATDPAEGFRHFDAMCVICHGAPGVEPSEIGQGLNPRPPRLQEEVKKWTPEELFWIVRHGLKMSGMPAFGPSHEEKALWSIVTFIRRLPEITPEDYRSLQEQFGNEQVGNGSSGGAGDAAQQAPPAPPTGDHAH